jgi:hypothetical protein
VPVTQRPLIARADELRTLTACLDEAAGGQGGCVLVAGEAGIGKTRLLEALSDQGRVRGFRVAWGRAWESADAPAFWPWREVLAELRAERAASDVGRADPMAGLDDKASAPAAALERARLFDDVRGFLDDIARRTPVLILLDDLHAADASSLVLAEFLARRMRDTRVLLAGSHREHEARRNPELALLIGRLARLGRVLLPKRLDAGQVADLVVNELGVSQPELVRMVHDASDGNPLFVREIARLLAARGRVDVVPGGVQIVLRERLATLSAATAVLLQTAALVGREFSVALVAEVAGLLPEVVADALAEAEAAALIEPASASAYRFVHGIWTEALIEAMSPAQRQRGHVRVADALERRHGQAPDAPYTAIAQHFLAGGASVAERAWRAAEMAAMRADGRLAFEDASQLYQSALATLIESAPEDLDSRLRLTLRLVAAHRRAGHVEAAWHACQSAAAWARDIGRPDILAEAALVWGAEFAPGEVDARHVALLEEALATLPEGDSALRARVLARLAAAEQPAPDPSGPVARAREAVAMLDRVAEPAARLPVLNAAAEAVLCYVPPRERLLLDEEVSALATAASDWPAMIQAKVRLAFAHVENGDPVASERAVAAVLGLADNFPESRLRWLAMFLGSMRSLYTGRFAEAAATEDKVAALLLDNPDSEAARALAIRKLARMATQTDTENLQDAVQATLPYAPVGSEGALLLTTWARVQSSHTEDAGRGLAQLSPTAIDTVLHDPALGLVLAETIRAAQHRELATLALQRLVGLAGRPVMLTLIGYALWDLADRVLLGLASLLARWDEADAFAASGEKLAVQIGARPFLARLRLDWARSLRARGSQSDRAHHLATQALDDAQAMGMPGLLTAAQAFLATRDQSKDGSPSPSSSLPTSAPSSPSAPHASRDASEATRDGEDWIFRGAGESCRLRDSRGARILSILLARPGQDIHVLDLTSDPGAVDGGDAGEILDAQARRDYQARLVELQGELDEATTWNDAGRVQELAREKEQLAVALAEAMGLGGRARRAGSAVERARVNVQRRIADAIARITKQAPALGRHLTISVRTGVFCAYTPH